MRTLSYALLSALFLLPTQVSAHATPVTYEPEASAVLERAPAEVMIRFSERVEAKTSSIRVLGADGGRVDGNDALPDEADAHIYRSSLGATGTGTYTVTWQVVSADDGHFTKGAYTFSVGQGSAVDGDTTQFQVIHSSTVREAFAIGLELLGQAVLLGMLTTMLLLFYSRKRGLDIPIPSVRRVTLVALAGTGFIVVGALLYLLIKAGDLSKVQETSFALAFQQFLTTVAGSIAAYRGGLALLFLLLFLPLRRVLYRTFPMVVLFIIVLAIMLLRARVSHAAASEWLPTFSVGVNFLHLIAKSLWVGGLIGLISLVFPSLSRGKQTGLFAGILLRSSQFLALVFGLTTVTGLYVIWLHLKEPMNIWSSLWGSRFLYLSAFAAVLVFFRLYHHFIVTPLAAKAASPSRLLRSSGATIIIEMLMGIIVLFFSGALIITTPPLTHAPAILGQAESQGMQLQLNEYPADERLLLLSIEGNKTEVTGIRDVSLTLTNEQQSIGPIVTKTEKRFDGGYVFPLSELSLPGEWKIDATVQRSSSYDAVATFLLNYPEQLTEARNRSEQRTFGGFELLFVLAAIAALVFTVFLYLYARSLRAKLQADSHTETVPTLTFGKLWGATLFGAFALFLIVGFHVQYVGATFRDTCKADSFYWHENVPMREGNVTSNKAMLGCMMGFGKGMYHLTDAREFAYFDRPAIGIASLQTSPPKIVTGTPTTLTFQLRDDKGQPVQELALSHDRILHIVIASDDFSVFDHIHVENDGPITEEMLKTATFPATFTFPKAGRYIVAVDFTIRAQEFAQEFYLNVEGSPETAEEPQVDLARTQTFDGYTVTLDAPTTIRAKNGVRLTYTFKKDGKPVEDIQPYLAAPMHIAVMREDLRYFSHAHGMLPRPLLEQITNLTPPTRVHTSMPDRFGPSIESSVMFPVAGKYVIFGEFKNQGKRVVTKFGVEVR